MKRTFAFALAALSLIAHTQVFAANLQWMNGDGICTGSWSFTRFGYCDYKEDPTRPLPPKPRDVVSYEPATCSRFQINVPEAKNYSVAETTSGSKEWEDSIVAQPCADLKPASAADDSFRWVQTGMTAEGPWNGRCKRRDWTKKCVEHHNVYRSTCTFERRVPTPITDEATCGRKEIHTTVYDPTGFERVWGYDKSCQGTKTEKTANFFSKTPLAADDSIEQASLRCSTLDEVASITDEQIRQKFDAYLALGFELSAIDGQCQKKAAVTNGLNTIAAAPGANGQVVLSEDQLTLVFAVIDSLESGCASETKAAKYKASHDALVMAIGTGPLPVNVKANSENRSPDRYTLDQGKNGNEFTLIISQRGAYLEIGIRADRSIIEILDHAASGTTYTPGTVEYTTYLNDLLKRLNRNLKTVKEAGPETSNAPLTAVVNLLTDMQSM